MSPFISGPGVGEPALIRADVLLTQMADVQARLIQLAAAGTQTVVDDGLELIVNVS